MDINQAIYDKVFDLVNQIKNTHGHKYHVFFDYTPKLDCAFIAAVNKSHDPINGWLPEREFVIKFTAPNRDGLIAECIEYLESIK